MVVAQFIVSSGLGMGDLQVLFCRLRRRGREGKGRREGEDTSRSGKGLPPSALLLGGDVSIALGLGRFSFEMKGKAQIDGAIDADGVCCMSQG